MKPLYIVRENTLIRMIKTNDHTIAVVINSENVLILRNIIITYESCYAITIV